MNITNYLSVNIIIKIYEHLHKIYSAKNFVSLEDLYESLDFVAGESLRPDCIRAHANLILRSAFYPSISGDNQCVLIMRGPSRYSSEEFLLSLYSIVDEMKLESREDSDVNEINQLKRDILRNVLERVDTSTGCLSEKTHERPKQILYSSVAAAATTARRAVVTPSSVANIQLSPSTTSPHSYLIKEDARHGQVVDDLEEVNAREIEEKSTTKTLSSFSMKAVSTQKESTKKVVGTSTFAGSGTGMSSLKFKAHGAEILECDLMDSILCCIYLLMTMDDKGFDQLYPNRPERTHRCIVDSITHVAELGLFKESFNNMSKTKIRAVTGILKSCGALIPVTQGNEISPCLLILSKSLKSFIECRAAVDAHIHEDPAVAAQPPSIKDKYMWTGRTMESRRMQTMNVMRVVREPIRNFLGTFVEPPIISPMRQLASQKGGKDSKVEAAAWSKGCSVAKDPGKADIDFLSCLKTTKEKVHLQVEPILSVDTALPPPGLIEGGEPSSLSPATTDEAGISPLGENDSKAAKDSVLPAYSLWGSRSDTGDCSNLSIGEKPVGTNQGRNSSIFGNQLIRGLP